MLWRYICAVMLLCAALARCDSEKRAEMSPMPFVMGSRYGRSSPRVMSPRNDRFFFGSRYGKRSEPTLASSMATAPTLLCEYTGVYALYRCNAPTAATRTLFNLRRGEEGPNDED